MTVDRATEIERRLTAAFSPLELTVKDQSHLHAGHAGARDGKGHFAIKIVSDKFSGHGRLARHRMVYAALDILMKTDIHALRINAISPSDDQGQRPTSFNFSEDS
jgi:BolA protein